MNLRRVVTDENVAPTMTHSFKTSLHFLAIGLAISACASGGKTSGLAGAPDGSPCALRAQDSVYARAVPVYRDCSVRTQAKLLTPQVAPDWNPAPGGATCYSAEVEFVVDANGMYEPGTARVVRASSQPFAESIVAVLPKYKFDPATIDGLPVRQVFNVKRSAEMAMRVVSSNGSVGTVSAPSRRSTAPKC